MCRLLSYGNKHFVKLITRISPVPTQLKIIFFLNKVYPIACLMTLYLVTFATVLFAYFKTEFTFFVVFIVVKTFFSSLRKQKQKLAHFGFGFVTRRISYNQLVTVSSYVFRKSKFKKLGKCFIKIWFNRNL